MTFSIVARSPDGQSWGVAVASRFLAVGAVVPAAAVGVGAIATQAFANLTYRPEGLRLLASGSSAQQTVDDLTGADEQRAHRQLGIVDATGESATFTGNECQPWAGGMTDDGVAIQGNILTGPPVLEAMHRAWREVDAPFPRKLLGVLQAGDSAGGDRRGRQSAALLVVTASGGYGELSDVQVDLRVDDHTAPCRELARLLDLHHLYFERPASDALVPMEGEVAARIDAALAVLGYPDLDSWLGVENFEMRVENGEIDRYVLGVLEEQAAAESGLRS